MYQALYRKWRPKTFDDMVGQESITVTLKNEVATGKFSHAYLFTGSRGTGKTSCSKIIAKAVNCEHPVDGNPCNACAICHGIDDGSVLDVAEIDAASNNGVDNIRQLREEAYFLPALAKFRVYILDECHMLSPGAVNALLKILEEPPEHVIFILATTEIHKVLPTILSRCQRFDFKRIKSRTIADRLLYVAEQETFTLEDTAAMLIARLSDGGMRDALSLLDLCASRGQNITAETVTAAAGLAGKEYLFELADALAVRDPVKTLTIIGALSENSVDFSRLCEQLAGHYRDLMIVKSAKEPDDLVQGTIEELERLRIQAKALSLNRILYTLDILSDTMGKLSRTAFKRTELEMAMVRLCDVHMGDGVSGVLERLEKLEDTVRAGGMTGAPAAPPSGVPQSSPAPEVAAPAASSAPAAPTAPAASSAPAASTASAAPAAKAPAGLAVHPFEEWQTVLEKLKKSNGALSGILVDSRAYTDGDIVLIDCENETFRTLLRGSPAAKESLRDAIIAVTGRKYNLGPYNPGKHTVTKEANDPLAGMLKKASELGVPVVTG